MFSHLQVLHWGTISQQITITGAAAEASGATVPIDSSGGIIARKGTGRAKVSKGSGGIKPRRGRGRG